jgi:hypothetical protein
MTDAVVKARAGESPRLKFRQLTGLYAIVRFAADAVIPAWATRGEFTSITRGADELSIVCSAENVPAEFGAGLRWVCLKLEGPFPFSQTGVLLSFIEPLSNNGVPIFAISTFDTDYVLVPQEQIIRAQDLLNEAGHERLVG